MNDQLLNRKEIDSRLAPILGPDEFLQGRIEDLMISDPQFHAALPLHEVNEEKLRSDLGLAEILAGVMQGYANRPAVGVRATELVLDQASGRTKRELLDHFETVTYGELWTRAKALAAFWHHGQEHGLYANDMLCIFGFAGIDFAVVDIAAIYGGIVSVPMQTNGQMAQLLEIMREVEPRWLASSIEGLDISIELVLNGHRPAGVLVFDYHPEVDEEREMLERARQRLTAAGLPEDLLITLQDAIARGAVLPSAPLFAEPDTDDRLSIIFYTSGSTGLPKGAMWPEKMTKRQWQSVSSAPYISVHFSPMNHAFGRAGLFSPLCAGGTCYFTGKSDLSELLDDIEQVRPTFMGLVPRICEMLFQQYQVELERRSPGAADLEALKQELFLEMRNKVLGGRLLGAFFGSAPLSLELRKFMEAVLGFPMTEAYGSTETGGILANSHIMSPPITDYRLDDVPELGYFGTDKPYPRGELWVKSACMMKGYYKRPEVTASVTTEEGFYKTGDIMAQLGPDHFVYLDRRNNVLKLAQGEFVAIAQIETIFTNGHALIQQAYLYGTSERSYLLGVLVPNEAALVELGIALDHDAAIKTALREAVKQVARTESLHPYEVPRDFLVEREPFSTENGLLAGIGKYQRPKFKERYGARLEQLYDDIADSQARELARLRQNGRQGPVIDTVARAVQATLGLEQIDPTKPATFAELGGDSLSALSCSLLLEEIYDVEVPAGVINNPAGSLRQIARFIERARETDFERPTATTIHGRGFTEIQASDFVLEKFIDAETLAAGHNAGPVNTDIRTVLVTGATGFLGRFLCLEWLERMAKVGGRVICITRGEDDAAAGARIAEVFDSGDPDLKRHFEVLASKHLEVLAGDLSEVDLGLPRAAWQRLAESVDLIVHPAAFVNHMLPYAQLFGPNVVGTAELIRLAITHHLKPVINISTVAAAMLPNGGIIEEDTDPRKATPVRQIDSTRYADGYANSKWAGEVLLHEAYERYGLPASVFRSNMILAHSRYKGQVNVPDLFTRWLASIVLTGLAPQSVYSGNSATAHYDGLPVEFTAEAISALGANILSGFRTYHVVNPHDDCVSMDSFVDWAIEAGRKIDRIDNYEDWASRFETALRNLPEKQRNQSSLPLIDQLRQPSPAQKGTKIPSHRFQADVQKHGLGNDGNIPHLTARFIKKYVRDLEILDLI